MRPFKIKIKKKFINKKVMSNWSWPVFSNWHILYSRTRSHRRLIFWPMYSYRPYTSILDGEKNLRPWFFWPKIAWFQVEWPCCREYSHIYFFLKIMIFQNSQNCDLKYICRVSIHWLISLCQHAPGRGVIGGQLFLSFYYMLFSTSHTGLLEAPMIV